MKTGEPPTNKFAAVHLFHNSPVGHYFINIAEEGGFEPPVPLRVRQFSKLVVSATHPSLRAVAQIQ